MWWFLYIALGVVGLLLAYAFIVLPIVLFFSSRSGQKCIACKEPKMNHIEFVTKNPLSPEDQSFVPAAFYFCTACGAGFKLERGEWDLVQPNVLKQMFPKTEFVVDAPSGSTAG